MGDILSPPGGQRTGGAGRSGKTRGPGQSRQLGIRVVAGHARGRRLVVPPGTDIRPTADRVREATFNSLASLDRLRGASVLDLFAGSGALGIEALSRGAAQATFVDQAAPAVRTIRANLDAVGFADRATVRAADGWRHLADANVTYGLVLLDPPYAFDDWDALLAAVAGRLEPAGLVVTESNRGVVIGRAEWEVLRTKAYGDTVVEIARLHLDIPHRSGASA